MMLSAHPRTGANLAWTVAVVCGVGLVGVAQGQSVLYSDDFDAGVSAAQWTLFSHAGDYTADFAFDYSAPGIPSAPNSTGGTTIGLKFTVNNNDDIEATDAVSAYPTGQSFDGNQMLKFDMWLNYNNGSGGGVGSTEFATAGLNHGATQVVWADNVSSNGWWYAVTGEGGASDDYRGYDGGTLLLPASTAYAANDLNHTADFYQNLFPNPTYETQGAPGKHWVEVDVRWLNGVLEWRLNGMLITIREQTTPPSGNIMLGYMDTWPSIATPGADNFVVFDNVRVEALDCNANGVADRQDLAGATSLDCNATGIPDECEPIGNGDYEVDGDRDLADVASFADCLNGPEAIPDPSDPNCTGACQAAFDFDDDSTVDLDDFADFQMTYTTGPIPPRPQPAPTGSQFISEVAALARVDRENRVLAEITGGNLPGFLREFVAIDVSANIGGTPTNATYYVMPDYLCVGVDRDFVRMPTSPLIAQQIADAFDCLLPTRKMVDDIYDQSAVKLAPQPISPATVDIMLATTFYRHHEIVEGQRAGQTLGALVGGIKKDVVVTPLLASNPGKVAIYGWHQLSGVPIQPLYLGHVDWYMDYSHGIRLVKQQMLVNGSEIAVTDVLADPDLHVLLSDEGVVSNPRY